MLFLFGERVHASTTDAGRRRCGICSAMTQFSHVTESLWFSVFGIRLLPIEKIANYLECSECHHAFGKSTDVPSFVPIAQRVVVYLLLGYGMHEHRDIAREICRKVTGIDPTEKDLIDLVRRLDSGKEDMVETLRRASASLNVRGKLLIIQAAFLMTHVCCEIQHADRVRINLMGTALGLSPQFVNAAIETIRDQGYFGVKRILPTQAV